MNLIDRFRASLKAFRLTWTRASSFGLTWLAGTKFDYQAAAGDGRTNAAVFACVRWVQRALPEAPLTVYVRNADGEDEPDPTHPLQRRIEQPNPYYSGLHLIGALVADLMLTGNAYVVKARNGELGVAELWWVPSSMIEPRWPDDGSEFIGWYEYAVDGRISRIERADVVHIRQGFDPRNIRKGLSDLEALFREIATDNEAANWTAAMVRNVNPPGVILSPEGDAGPSEADLVATKARYMDLFGGDHRGEPMVMSGPTKVSILSFSPEQMNLREIRNIPEERITAVFGIPAAVVGLGTGLEQTKVGATMSEQREQAYESCLIPLQRLIAAELQMQLVPDFGTPERLRVRFDLSEVRVLQDDQNALHERVRADWLAGLYSLNDALQEIGKDPLDGEQGDIRLLPNTVTVKTLDTLIPEEQPAALAEPTPLRALPAPSEDEAAATRAFSPPSVKAADLSDTEIVERYEAGLATLAEDLADDLMGAFEEIADVALARYPSLSKSNERDGALEEKGGRQDSLAQQLPRTTPTSSTHDRPPQHTASLARGGMADSRRVFTTPDAAKANGDAIDGLVTLDSHEPIKRLLRSYVLKGMRQAAEDLADLTGGPVRIQRNNPAVRAAVADMEARLPGIAATTAEDFGRLLRRLERRPGSVPLSDVRTALLDYVAESYPSRAETIARTELSAAHGRGVLLVAEKSGIASRVHISDGDDDGPCKERNGTTATLEEARGIGLLHPNCRLRLIPILAA